MAHEELSPRRRRVERWVFAAICVAIIAGAVALGLRGGKVDRVGEGFDPPPETMASVPAAVPAGPEQPEQSGKPGRILFAETCGTCHTLTAAGTRAPIGPNLDRVRLTKARVLAQIRNGSVDNTMPEGLLTGADAERVAGYVAREAGSER